MKQWPFRTVQEQIVVPEVEPSSPTPLLLTTEEKELTPTSSTGLDLRMRIGVTVEDEGVCDVDMVGNDEGSGYMRGNLDADETPYSSKASSGYETREKVFVQVAPDEQAEGYRGTDIP